ncbi:RNA-binding (RRM/RBD/RNP motifs) family protein [Actinidia rufa]|uniref:RNA-binding (RRM/RBD/RNP motifs) family protein n=1 Tax=Actinidia rufa TaxID=165716 RepID=A0A7J0FUW9_9ERIC|nr:RNA-binding (RRM/RBD/RNP motifs) family protein [Actinidia rufa]
MPRTRASAAAAKSTEPEKPSEPEKPVESEEKVDFDGDNDHEETVEEEVEYEEVEEEEEEVEGVEEEEEVEEEVEDEEEEEEEEADATNGADGLKGPDGDVDMKVAEAEEDVENEHAELLALPPHGSEVYLGGIPLDASEEDLRSFCESVGEVTEVRIMKGKDSTENKGEKRSSVRHLKQSINCSLVNVPRNWGEEDMKKVVAEIGPGVITVELLKDPQNSSRNRVGADPKNAESSAASQVKAVYVKNLPKNITQDQLREVFEHHGKITKVVLPPAKAGQEKSRFGFVHFTERSSAMKALKNTEKYEIDGKTDLQQFLMNKLCRLLAVEADQKSFGGPNSQKSPLLPSYPPRLGYGLVGGPYGAVGAGFGGGGFGQSCTIETLLNALADMDATSMQPLIYGRGPSPSGMAMMPMLLPDGRIGYVLQQPGAQPHTPPPQQRSGRSGGGGRSGGSGSSSGGRRGSDSERGRRSRYNPY